MFNVKSLGFPKVIANESELFFVPNFRVAAAGFVPVVLVTSREPVKLPLSDSNTLKFCKTPAARLVNRIVNPFKNGSVLIDGL